MSIIFPNYSLDNFKLKDCEIESWNIVNDDVMGGLSNSELIVNHKGFLIFKGSISTENNGGFTMIKYDCHSNFKEAYNKIVLKVIGDGKRYKFRIKDKISTNYAYLQSFKANKGLQLIELPLKEFYPSYRGRKLNFENFNKESIDQIAILIGNKKNEQFTLEILEIKLK